MKYVDEFRDGELARKLAASIARTAQPGRNYNFMEFCGGHTHAISRYGLSDLLPPAINMIHGPGCPVCVLPIGRIDLAIGLALQHRVILCSYADCLRVPAGHGLSLLKAKAQGADVRMVYSVSDALQLARQNPQQHVVFLAIGFETTTPPTAVAVRQADALGLKNFSVLCNHVLTPAAMRAILAGPSAARLHGFVGPAHVSTVIGSRPYATFAADYGKAVVIAGFEPLDLLQAILMLLRQINEGRAELENEFTRAVTPDGNRKAQALIDEVFERRESFEWRGLGSIPHSALKLRQRYAGFDAEARFGLEYQAVQDSKGCECAAILRGEKRPPECRIFGTACTPDTPVGACMVSAEGACAAHYTYGRFKDSAAIAAGGA
jgi:hydrogenase expression/formation protein HypD